jgi:hypothetical protein
MGAVRPTESEQSNFDRMTNRAGHNLIVFTFDLALNSPTSRIRHAHHQCNKKCRHIALRRGALPLDATFTKLHTFHLEPPGGKIAIVHRSAARSWSWPISVTRDEEQGFAAARSPAAVNEPYSPTGRTIPSGRCIPTQPPRFERGEKPCQTKARSMKEGSPITYQVRTTSKNAS